MARTARSSKLETRTSRLKLAIGERHYVRIGKGISLGYRRGPEGSGNWEVRVFMPDGRYDFRALAKADDFIDANESDVLDYYAAQDRARQAAEDMRHPTAVSARRRKLTVKAAVDHYMDWYRHHGKSVKGMETTINAHILPAFGDMQVVDLDSQAIRKWHQDLSRMPARKRTSRYAKAQQFRDKPATEEEKRARKSTANRVLTVFKAILNKAYDHELVKDNQAWSKVKAFRRVEEPVIRFLTEAESTRLVNACAPDLRSLIHAALFTGARYSEITAMRAMDFNSNTGSIFINPGKSGRGRHVPLNREGMAFFSELAAGKKGSELLFIKSDGTPWGKNHHVRALKEACRNARIEPEITFHELRHTYASLLAQAGADLLVISKLLGHSDTRMTSKHYAHLCDRTLANAVRNLLPGFGHKPDRKVRPIA
ncbi:MAG: site-specific integrase [Betaproteobacteria bacterium HGW-Betaproteobacteria-14]|nr:MAG: site-specific integrase [Betaproteobacteria bacterium HGW-Betaproteobacteria-14]